MYENINKKNIELLSPAGSIDSFNAAIQTGADAIYMGLDKYNARQMANNFNLEEYIECIKYAHLRGVKVYLTINILFSEDEIKEICNIVLELYSKGLDAVIVQDIGLATLLKKIIPDITLHASTQMSVYNLAQVKYLEKIGFSRVVLARELSIEEIEYICKNTKMQIEVFVHGALCVSVSGQCLLSYEIGKRSANRGSCAQPCRMKYSLYNSNNKEVVKNTYILSKKDIYGLENLEKLVKAGVLSFKIEGRNKTPEYVAIVTRIYRKYLDKVIQNEKIDVLKEDKENLMQTFNRNGLSSGYLDCVDNKNSITTLSAKNTGIYLGEVVDKKSVYVKVKLDHHIDMQDGIEIYSKDLDVVSNIVTCIKDDKFRTINTKCSKGDFVWLGDIKANVYIGSKVYKTSSYTLNKEAKTTYENNKEVRKIDASIDICIKENLNLKAKIKVFDKTIDFEFCYIPELAKNKEIAKEDIENNFKKTSDKPINFKDISVDISGDLFIPTSKLNEFRRNCIEKIEESFEIDIDVENNLKNVDKVLNEFVKIKQNKNDLDKKTMNSLYVYSFDNTKDYLKIYEEKFFKKLDRIDINVSDYIKNKESILKKYLGKVDIYLNLPSIINEKQNEYIEKMVESFLKEGIKGFVIGNLGYIDMLKKYKFESDTEEEEEEKNKEKQKDKNKNKYPFVIIADYSINVSNIYSACFLATQGVDVIVYAYDSMDLELDTISKFTDIEIVQDIITVMTSRYCILANVFSEIKENEKEEKIQNTKKCDMPCVKDSYYLKDSYSNNYNIVCDNTQCIMRITKRIENDKISKTVLDKIYSIRHCI